MFDKFGLLDPVTRANLERQEMVDSQLASAPHVARGLQEIDPRLKLCFFGQKAEPLYGIKPGRWHVFLDNEPGKPDSYYPIVGANGSFREPDWGVVEAMKMADMWSSDYELPSDSIDEHEEAAKKQGALKSEQRRDNIAADYATAKRVAGDGGLTKRKWGKA